MSDNDLQDVITEAILYLRKNLSVDHSTHDPRTCNGELSWKTKEARDLYHILLGDSDD